MNLKKQLFILLLLVSQINELKAGFFEIDASETVINFSSYCTIGKITVFVMSQHRCNPCINAKEFFKTNYSNNKTVDVYYCLITKDNADLESFKKRPSNIMWGYVETYKSSPRVYFYTPSGNQYGYIDGFDRKKSEDVMNSMLKNMSYFNRELVSFNNSDNRQEKRISVNNKHKNSLDNYSNYNETQENENNQLNYHLTILQNENEKLQEYNLKLINEINSKDIIVEELNNQIQQLSTSNIEIQEQNEQIANSWYLLAKNYEKQLESKKVKKNFRVFIINQAQYFYEKSLQQGGNCHIEYNEFKQKYKLD